MQARFVSGIATSFVFLQILFLANMCYLYATQFNNSSRAHTMKILYVDYDGDVVGQSVSRPYQSVKGDSFPTVQQLPKEQYSRTQDVRGAVCSGDYWAAIYTAPHASTSLADTLANGTASQNTSLTFIWNGARYPLSLRAKYTRTS